VVPQDAAPADLALARALAAELSDRYGLGIRVTRVSTRPAGRFILMGGASNRLLREFRSRAPQKAEGYMLRVSPQAAIVAGYDNQGAFYGMQSLRQLIRKTDANTEIRGAEIEDWPHVPFRGIRLYLPGHENIAFFKRFLRDFMALYKFNKVILEVNASMRLDHHPEVNAGWIDFAKDLYYTQRYYPQGPRQTYQNSAHHDTADGEILEKDEVADLVRYASSQHIEVIPEIPTYTHSYYLLTRHKQFGAITGAEWPDVYCPSDPDVYKLVFDVIDEYVEVMKPRMIHIGHDEMFFPVELCRCCVGRDPALLWADDVKKIHDYLATKGIRTALYGDHLVESVRGVHRTPIKSKSGWAYHMPGALTPEQVRELIPKDIVVANWFWHDHRAAEGRGEPTDIKLSEFGFQQIHANFMPLIQNYERRSTRAGVLGGAPSSWAASNEYTFGKDLMIDFLGTANLMWSTHWPDEERLSKIVQSLMPEARRRLSGRALPSEDGDPVEPVPLAGGAAPISIGADVSSIVFRHACEKPASNDMSYRYIHNFPDTADLLGWYEVVYEDGFVETVPVRYGWNILPRAWITKSDAIQTGSSKEMSYAYAAEAMPDGTFRYEWVNPRFGKIVKEVRLHHTQGFRDTKGKVAPENAIQLLGLGVVKKRPVPSARGEQ
jgi:hexosaminidase